MILLNKTQFTQQILIRSPSAVRIVARRAQRARASLWCVRANGKALSLADSPKLYPTRRLNPEIKQRNKNAAKFVFRQRFSNESVMCEADFALKKYYVILNLFWYLISKRLMYAVIICKTLKQVQGDIVLLVAIVLDKIHFLDYCVLACILKV